MPGVRNTGSFTVMRIIIILLAALFASPALAQDWERYENARFGFGIDIPSSFAGGGEQANGEGQRFDDMRGRGLVVWGGDLAVPFEAEFADIMDYAVAENGWNITYQVVTPRWAGFSGVSGSQMVYQRMILLCDGASFAAFRAVYSSLDLTEMDAVTERMAQSMRGNC